MEWTNNLAKLVSEVDLWTMFSGKSPFLCELYSVYEQIGEEKIYLEMELGDMGLLADFDEKDRKYKLNPKFTAACNSFYSPELTDN
jgi:hypothetical protein